MAHVNVTPYAVDAAAGDLASVGSTINAANANAKAGTTGVQAPGGDSVSAFVVALFAAHAQAYQTAGAQAATYHDQFVQALRASAGSYARTEDTNVSLQKTSGLGSGPGQTSAGHLNGNSANGTAGQLIDDGANAAANAAQHGAVNAPPPGIGTAAAPSPGNGVAAGPDASGGGGHAAATAGPQGGSSGGGDGNDVGGGPGAATNGGGGGELADPRGAGGGAVGAGVPAAWGPPVSAAPGGSFVPGLATAPVAPAVMAGGYPAAAGLAGLGASGFSGDSPAIGGLGEPVAPAVSAEAASAVAEPATPTAPKAQQPLHEANPLHQGNPAHQGNAEHPHDGDYDNSVVPLLLPPLRLPSLRGLRGKLRLGLRDKDEWHKELREAAIKKPWGRDELLGALGLRPPSE
jgi:PE family